MKMTRELLNLALITGAIAFNSDSRQYSVVRGKKHFTNIQQRASNKIKKTNRARRKAANLSRAKNRGK